MQKRELIYSVGNLLTLIGIIILVVFTLLPLAMGVSGLLRTGINILSSILLLTGSGIPIILREIEISQRLRSMGVRFFTTSFIISIIMVLQMLTRGWASTVPTSASILLSFLGIVAYILSAKGGKLNPPPFKEVILITSVIIIFITPMLQLSLTRLGVGSDASRTISIGLLIAFAATIYLSIKFPFRRMKTHDMEREGNKT
ncbi:MAG: hypothetical protein NZ873_01670 [Crenarchaeota archaeon]|nr:hypothetical protein [Thermoproteota archaeon]MDW8034104.1 hypothetical protein [Nitrososphaerota archaeon]